MTDETEPTPGRQPDLLRLSTGIITAYVSHHAVEADAIPELVRSIHASLAGLQGGEGGEPQAEKAKPAVPIAKSIQADHLVCLEDGKQLKMLKRYLQSQYGLSPDDYRRKWALPPDYPMVAPSYAARRSDFAKQIGLGKGVRRKTG